MEDKKKDVFIRKAKYYKAFIFPIFVIITGIAATAFAFYGLGTLLYDILLKNSFWN